MSYNLRLYNTLQELLGYHSDNPITPCVSFSETDEIVMYEPD